MGLDAVEMVLCWEDSLEITIPEALLANIETPADSIDMLVKFLDVKISQGPSLVQRAFHRLRHTLITEFAIPRSRIKPTTRFTTLFPKNSRRNNWLRLEKLLQVDRLPVVLGWPLFLPPGGTTIEDVVIDLVAQHASKLKRPGEPWAKSQIREIVRCSVLSVLGLKKFKDSDSYSKDMNMD